MDSYNFFVSGCVHTLQFKPVSSDKVLVYARVSKLFLTSRYRAAYTWPVGSDLPKTKIS